MMREYIFFVLWQAGAWPGRLNTVIRTPCPSKECVGLLWQIRKFVSVLFPHMSEIREICGFRPTNRKRFFYAGLGNKTRPYGSGTRPYGTKKMTMETRWVRDS